MQDFKSILLAVLSATLGQYAAAQTLQQNSRWHFQSVNGVGWLHGKTNNALQLQTVNGLRRGRWFIGIGTGVDDYRLRSIPLFFDARKDVGGGRNHFFLYADAGMNWYWQRSSDPKLFYTNSKVSNGIYTEAGIGCSSRLSEKISLVFSGGFSYKQLAEKGSVVYYTDIMNWNGGNPYILPGSTATVQHCFSRLVVKAGIVF
jgi:hypothetical protein